MACCRQAARSAVPDRYIRWWRLGQIWCSSWRSGQGCGRRREAPAEEGSCNSDQRNAHLATTLRDKSVSGVQQAAKVQKQSRNAWCALRMSDVYTCAGMKWTESSQRGGHCASVPASMTVPVQLVPSGVSAGPSKAEPLRRTAQQRTLQRPLLQALAAPRSVQATRSIAHRAPLHGNAGDEAWRN